MTICVEKIFRDFVGKSEMGDWSIVTSFLRCSCLGRQIYKVVSYDRGIALIQRKLP